MYIEFIKHRKIFYGLSLFFAFVSIASILVFGLNLGIEFTGGSSLELLYQGDAPSFEEIRTALQELDLGDFTLQKTGEDKIIIKMRDIPEETHKNVLAKLNELGGVKQGSESFQTIGSVIGEELKQKTKFVVFLSLLTILIFIAVSFKKISRPVKSYVYGLTGVIALVHDVLIPLGVLAILGRYCGVEITIPIITAFLTVFGYSINDSVVVFDRLRENIIKLRVDDFDKIINDALNQTLIRSLFTGFCTLITLFAIFFFGGETLKYFSLTLIIGIVLGTYSSIFIATPLLVTFHRFRQKQE